jgi:hypothetical protein
VLRRKGNIVLIRYAYVYTLKIYSNKDISLLLLARNPVGITGSLEPRAEEIACPELDGFEG